MIVWESSCKPRNSRAFVPESTVVTAMKKEEKKKTKKKGEGQ